MLTVFYREIKKRKIRKWLTIYLSTSLTLIGAVHLFSIRYRFPEEVFDTMLIILLCGIPFVLVLSWFHGEEGVQKLKLKEVIYYCLNILVTVVLVYIRLFSAETKIPEIPEKSIAVLPFENYSDNKEDEFFINGVTEDIMTQLSKISDLKVISRPSVLKYKNSDKSIREIGQELGSETILTGSIRRSGERIRIVSQLIDTKTDQQIWAETYDRKIEDVFNIQSEVAQKIAFALNAKLTEDEKSRIEHFSTNSLDAYTVYLKGREFYNRYTKEDNEEAIKFFRKALGYDPDFALAYAGLGDSYAQKYGRFGFPASWLDSSIAMSKIAIELNSEIAEPHKSLGVAYVYKGDLNNALQQYIRAVELNPNYVPAMTNVGFIYWMIGEYDKAVPYILKSAELEPTRNFNYRILGLIYSGLELYGEAEKWFDKALELQTSVSSIMADKIKLYILKEDYTTARNYIQSALEKEPDNLILLRSAADIEFFSGNSDSAFTLYSSVMDISSVTDGPATEYAFLLKETGRTEEAEKIFQNVLKNNLSAVENGTQDFNVYYDLARIYSALGKRNESLRYLQLSIDYGWRFYRFTLSDPFFKKFKNDNGFNKMMSMLKKQVGEMRARIEIVLP
ncbi:MAG: hypothetical protein Kow0098_04320 [Ignavibacteriaceae bacterium]